MGLDQCFRLMVAYTRSAATWYGDAARWTNAAPNLSQLDNGRMLKTGEGDGASAARQSYLLATDIVFRQSVVAIVPTIPPLFGFALLCLVVGLMEMLGPSNRFVLEAFAFGLALVWVLSLVHNMIVFVAAFVTHAFQLRFATRALTLRVMPATIRMSGMSGRRTRRVVTTYQLDEVSLEHEVTDTWPTFIPGLRLAPRVGLRSLTIKHQGESTTFRGLVASKKELDALIRSVEVSVRNAHDRIGDGEEEVPGELRAMVRSKSEAR